MVLISGSLDLPWDAPLFTEAVGKILIFTSSETSLRTQRRPSR